MSQNPLSGGPTQGKVVVVPGGTGNVGEGIVRAFLAAGATVVVPSRSAVRLEELKTLVDDENLPGRMVGVEAAYDTFAAATELAETVVRDHGRIDHVVASIGGWWQGKTLWQTAEDDWQQNFVDVGTTHLAVARAFVPRLEDDGSYTLIAGFSGRKPYAGAGIVSMIGAGLLMMREVLSAELRGQRRVNDLVLGPIVNRSRPDGDPSWLTADQVGQAAVHVAEHPEIADRSITLDHQGDLGLLLGTDGQVS
jgi:NAD(P)-dependent dehydrogenase (short-subunit alcohol dehydrogenase family)